MSFAGTFTSPHPHQGEKSSIPPMGSAPISDDGADAITLHPGVVEDDHEIQRLARTMSRRSHASVGTTDFGSLDPLHPEPGSAFDPFGDKFKPAAWSKAIFALHTANPEAPAPRSSGIAFENLSAHGFGSDADYQATVGNMPLKAWGAVKSLVSSLPASSRCC